jgi:hypothetical protein
MKNISTLLISLAAILLVGLACGSKTPPPAQYVGAWTGDDGSTVTIRADGSGDYVSGGTKVSGGSVAINENEKSLKISLVSMGPTFTIDKAPSGNRMTLSGVVYRKAGDNDTKAETASEPVKAEIPSGDKLQTLVKTTFMDFGDAVQSEDFTDFYAKIAKIWRDETSPAELKDAFQVFIDNKEDYDFKRAITPLDATFSPEPAMQKSGPGFAMVVKGYYPTKPQRANFEMKFVNEDGTWKLIGINIKTEPTK